MFNAKRTKNQEQIITQLYEIFAYDKNIIISICEARNWQINDCIENLVAYGEKLTAREEIQEKNETSHSYVTTVKKIDNRDNKENIKGTGESVRFNHQLGAVPKNLVNARQRLNELTCDSKIKAIADHIALGHKIMIIMRGAPGSGKSYLARQLIQFMNPSGKYDCKSFICSTDDYFYDVNDKYVYQADRLSDAHDFNQRRIRKKAMEGWSPLIVDNTNIKIWEMLIYAQIAVQYGYLVELLEPNTPWQNSASKLALKNKHGVTREKIKRILMNYEPATREQLLQMMKNTQYTVSLPQIRRYPPVEIQGSDVETSSTDKEETGNVNIKNITPDVVESADLFKSNVTWLSYKNDTSLLSEKHDAETDTSEVLVDTKNSTQIISSSCQEYDSNPNEKCNDIVVSEKENISSNSWAIYNSSAQAFSSGLKVAVEDVVSFEPGNKKFSDNDSDSWAAYNGFYYKTHKTDKENNESKPPRDKETRDIENEDVTIENSNQYEDLPIEWKPYESESNEFWNGQKKDFTNKLEVPKPQRKFKTTDTFPHENIFKILKDEGSAFSKTDNISDKSDKLKNVLKRHSVNCSNEDESFTLIRQICPDKNVNGLWDLFEKCNGNAQWVLDILLKDDTSVESIQSVSEVSDYNCNCNNKVESESRTIIDEKSFEHHSKNYINNNDLQKQKCKKSDKTIISDELQKMKLIIENRVVMDKSKFSGYVKKIRNAKHYTENNANNLKLPNILHNETNENDCENFIETTKEEEMVEINLGKELIDQLENLFGVRPIPNLKDLKTNVFMPKSFGKKLYALWMESIYNQLEEEKQVTIKRDEEFAKLLQSTSEANTAHQESYKDILDMELAWSIYKSNPDQWKDANPQNLASFLAHNKLCEIFPEIEKDTLLQILQAHGNSFSQTFNALNCSIDDDSSDIINEKKNKLLKLANEETEDKLSEDSPISKKDNPVRKLSPDESKKAALRDFEECRNLAAHHSQLAAECYKKAKEAIQKGNSAVAVYYSQISNLHKSKIDYYNHKAANCIMEVHDLTQNNPDFIDLHYLHTMEALECLDIFLDNHILKLRNMNRPYKHIFIITGRGLHSAKGVSTIKNRVKSRLKDRTLKWSEVNPGLLKVKVFSASKFSKNS